ncbi:Two component transcriptional regulator, winged helix family (fragment) [Desulforamulus hydrothermalis Lam5 = DSM 18033]|uniref:Two component transcriptional regulator, winged helix family n=1 Tax=Desulforamulus hydrothermalis Lam5 = DSM 18033 TaxID=1121428 RepID=K8DXV6_9FIRM
MKLLYDIITTGSRIKSHIRKHERLKGNLVPAKINIHKGLEINTASGKVYVNGREVQMTAREYELLVFLASNPGIVFSKEHILTRIWGEDYYGDTATAAGHIQK